MYRSPPSSKRTYTRFPSTTLFRSEREKTGIDPGDVELRHHRHHDVVGAVIEARHRRAHPPHRSEVAVAEHDALGTAGGAAGVELQGIVVGLRYLFPGRLRSPAAPARVIVVERHQYRRGRAALHHARLHVLEPADRKSNV